MEMSVRQVVKHLNHGLRIDSGLVHHASTFEVRFRFLDL